MRGTAALGTEQRSSTGAGSKEPVNQSRCSTSTSVNQPFSLISSRGLTRKASTKLNLMSIYHTGKNKWQTQEATGDMPMGENTVCFFLSTAPAGHKGGRLNYHSITGTKTQNVQPVLFVWRSEHFAHTG